MHVIPVANGSGINEFPNCILEIVDKKVLGNAGLRILTNMGDLNLCDVFRQF